MFDIGKAISNAVATLAIMHERCVITDHTLPKLALNKF